MNIKPLTNEIEFAKPIYFKESLSKGGMLESTENGKSTGSVLLEISEEGKTQYKLSKSALTQVEMTIKLSSKIKSNKQERLSTGNYLEDLAYAYDQVHKTLNENSENSNKNGKYLDEAFRNLANANSALSAAQIGRSITNEPFSVPLVSGVNPFVDSARKQADIFSDSFLKEYKKSGINALGTALEKLSGMPETDSLLNISYKDLNILTEKFEMGMFNTKSDINNMLSESRLSDFMKNYLVKLAE